MKRTSQLKPQDILLVLRLACTKSSLSQLEIAKELEISPSEVSFGLSRLRHVHLLQKGSPLPLRENLLEFLIHGVKYMFPAELGPIRRGVPTAHSAPPLSKLIKANLEDRYVWPHDQGTTRGQSITPIYRSAPDAARRDKGLYELLVLLDAIRIGRVREQKFASDALRKLIVEKSKHAQ